MSDLAEMEDGFYWALDDEGVWTMAEKANGTLWVMGNESNDWTTADFTRLVRAFPPAGHDA